MTEFKKSPEIRWSDLDPNFHVRHSVYYDWGAYCRMCFLVELGLSPNVLTEHQFGPILFREECTFRKELRFGDDLTIDLHLVRSRQDFSRWTIRHSLFKNGDVVAAILSVDGAWIDTAKRKLTAPPQIGADVFSQMPKSPDFEWINK
ncbi:MAG: thioesterase family protein [Chitinophagaceae bacterium]|nr:thioesterase family protein [Chitinophagaceae bacterium]